MTASKQVAFDSADGVGNLLTVFGGEPDKPCFIITPAMGVPAHKYLDLAQALNARGFSAATFDLRGLGNSSVRASRQLDYGYNEIITQDFPAAISALQAELADRPLVFLGHSLGGQLASLYISLNPNIATGIILCASCSVGYRGWPFPRNVLILVLSQIAMLIARLIGYFPGRKLGFAGKEASTVMCDWAKNARSGKYIVRGSDVNFEQALKALQQPILAINFTDDDLAPLSASQRLIDKFDSREVTYLCLSAGDLNQTRADHFSWLRSPDVIAGRVADWVQQSLN